MKMNFQNEKGGQVTRIKIFMLLVSTEHLNFEIGIWEIFKFRPQIFN